jgi:hypothetical protein
MTGLLRSGGSRGGSPPWCCSGTVASLGAAPGSDLGPVLLSPAAVGYLLLARQVLRGRGRARPGRPAAAPVRQPARRLR